MILYKNRSIVRVFKSFIIFLGILFFMGVSNANLWAASVKRGGVLRAAKKMTVPTLDLHKSNEYFTSLAGMYECLIDTRIDPKTHELTLVPMLSEKFFTEKNGLQLVFKLRKGIKFHDGVEVTAKDSKFSIEQVMRPESKAANAGSLRETIESIEVKDPYTLVIHCKKPAIFLSAMLSNIDGNEGMIQPKPVQRMDQRRSEGHFSKGKIGNRPRRGLHTDGIHKPDLLGFIHKRQNTQGIHTYIRKLGSTGQAHRTQSRNHRRPQPVVARLGIPDSDDMQTPRSLQAGTPEFELSLLLRACIASQSSGTDLEAKRLYSMNCTSRKCTEHEMQGSYARTSISRANVISSWVLPACTNWGTSACMSRSTLAKF